jgi:hypothetical protein
MRAKFPTYLSLPYLAVRTILVNDQTSSISSLLHSLVTSSLLGPNISFSTLFSNTLNLRSFLNVRDEVSYPYTTAKL